MHIIKKQTDSLLCRIKHFFISSQETRANLLRRYFLIQIMYMTGIRIRISSVDIFL